MLPPGPLISGSKPLLRPSNNGSLKSMYIPPPSPRGLPKRGCCMPEMGSRSRLPTEAGLGYEPNRLGCKGSIRGLGCAGAGSRVGWDGGGFLGFEPDPEADGVSEYPSLCRPGRSF
jgi:hypothetical protein